MPFNDTLNEDLHSSIITFRFRRRETAAGNPRRGCGARKPARGICGDTQRLGFSRVPVREALFALEREGLVEFSTTGRAYVNGKRTPVHMVPKVC